MPRTRRNPIGCVLLASTLLLCATAAEALPITGGIRFAGAIEPIDDWQTVSEIDIVNNVALVLCSPLMPCSGAFAGLNNGVAEYNDFSFDPLGGSITPLWSFSGFSFHLTEIASITRGPNGIILSGFGTLFGPGYDATRSAWSFSADQTNTVFAFSSTTSALPVPDSGPTVTLLGFGILALAFARSRLS